MDDKIKDINAEKPGQTAKKPSTTKSKNVTKKNEAKTKKDSASKTELKKASPSAKKTTSTSRTKKTTTKKKTEDKSKTTKTTTKKASTGKKKTEDAILSEGKNTKKNVQSPSAQKKTKSTKEETKKFIEDEVKEFETRLNEISLSIDNSPLEENTLSTDTPVKKTSTRKKKSLQENDTVNQSVTDASLQNEENNLTLDNADSSSKTPDGKKDDDLVEEKTPCNKLIDETSIDQPTSDSLIENNEESTTKTSETSFNENKSTLDLTLIKEKLKSFLTNRKNNQINPQSNEDSENKNIPSKEETEGNTDTDSVLFESDHEIKNKTEVIDDILDVEPIPLTSSEPTTNLEEKSESKSNESPTLSDSEPLDSKTDLSTNSIDNEELSESTHSDNDSNEYDSEKTIFGLPVRKKTDYNELEETIVIKKISEEFDSVELPNTKKPSLGKKIWASLIIFTICIGLLVGGVGLGILSQVIKTSPELNLTDFTGAESSKIFNGEGEVIAELGAYLRENITYDDLPESVIDSFIAIEDSRYFTHPGFDLPRFTKAFIENIKTKSFGQGGSTFTMQLVKNTYFSIDDIEKSTTAEKSIERKLQEIYIALKIENEFSKEEIFEKYLNKLNFGGNIRGIQKAALYYFGKDISDVTLSEAALLAGIVNLPNIYNPYNYLDAATKRRDTVLDLMTYHGYITKDESELAKAIKIEDLLIGEENTYNRTNSQYQSYIDAVIDEAQKLTGKDPALASMKIYTYMNTDVQEVIDSIQDGSAGIPFPDDLMQTAIISMDNRTGAIVGIGGGRNYEGARLLNRAISGFKQPGSAVKPFLSYALAFEHLYWSNKHVLTDRPYTYRGSTLLLKNFDGKYRGDVLIDRAVAESLNIPAIDTLQQVVDKIGKDNVAKYLQTIGFTKVTEENFDLSYAIGGSSYETTVKEMAGAHAMLINGGVYNEPHTIQKIIMQDGTVIYPENQNVKVISNGSAYLVAELMLYAVDGPYYNYMQVLRRDYPVYGKTGTSDWGKDGMVYGIPQGAAKDKWMIASSTQFTNAVWLGYDKGIKGKSTYFNGYKNRLNLPGKISVLLMDAVEKTSTVTPTAITRTNDIEDITYVLGSYPYAAVEPFTSGMAVTAEIRKGHPDLAPLSESALKEAPSLSSMSAYFNPDGSLSVSWHVKGRCSGSTKDLSLHDGKNNVSATGACIFDPSIASGGTSYYGTVYIDEMPLYNISSGNGYYSGWPGDMYGSVKVCGGASNSYGSSGSQCAYATWPEYVEPTY